MKGLLLKDWYMMKKYCRSYLLIAVVFLGVSAVSDSNMFYSFYPVVLFGMIPINLLAFDERSRWTQYCDALPCSRAQVVTEKYMIGLLAQLAVLFASCVIQTGRMIASGSFKAGDIAVYLLMALSVALVAPSLSLPFIFWLGVEKGRIVYLCMIGAIVAGSIVFLNTSSNVPFQNTVEPGLPIIVGFVVAAGLFVISWALSVKLYARREL